MQRPVFETSHERGMNACHFCWRRVRKDHPAHIRIALHRIARIDLHRTATPNDHDASAFCENGKILPEIHISEHFKNHVNAVTVGRLHDLLKMVGRSMVEHFVSALFTYKFASFVTTRGAEHAQTPSSRQLYRRRPNTTAGAMHQHGFALLATGALQ